MASEQDLFIPANPENTTLRPLDKGIILDKPPQVMPPGSFLEARNLMVGPEGLKRRETLTRYGIEQATYPPVQDLGLFWSTDGTQSVLFLDQKYLYLITGGGTMMRQDFVYTTAATVDCAAGSTTVEASADTHWNDWTTAYTRAGDIFVFDPDGANEEAIELETINTGLLLELKTAAAVQHLGEAWEIRRAFGAVEPEMVDWTIVPGSDYKAVFADGERFLYEFDGSTFQPYQDASTVIPDWKPQAVAFFRDRIWCGRIEEAGADYRARLRYSTVFGAGINASFSEVGSGYYDIPYTPGRIVRLVPLQNTLIAYFDDAIWAGVPGNYIDPPLVFQRIESGGIGLVGPKAIYPGLGGHFLVGQDNIYFLNQEGLEPIGTSVVQGNLRQCQNIWRIQVAPDHRNDRYLFGFPKGGKKVEDLWSYNYKSNSWSHEEYEADAFNTLILQPTATSWSDLRYGDGGILPVASVVDEGTPASGTTAFYFHPDLFHDDFFHDDFWTDTGSSSGKGVTTSGVVVTGVGTNWLALVAPDDLITFDPLAAVPVAKRIRSVESDTQFTLFVAPAAPYVVETPYKIERSSWTKLGEAYPSWGSMQAAGEIKRLFLFKDGYLFYFTNTPLDASGSAPTVVLTTPDFDYDVPDHDKLWLRVSLKIQEPINEIIHWRVYGSVNRGQSWKEFTREHHPMMIPPGETETKCDFRLAGSIGRFMFVSSSACSQYTINELVFRVKVLGLETPGRNV